MITTSAKAALARTRPTRRRIARTGHPFVQPKTLGSTDSLHRQPNKPVVPQVTWTSTLEMCALGLALTVPAAGSTGVSRLSKYLKPYVLIFGNRGSHPSLPLIMLPNQIVRHESGMFSGGCFRPFAVVMCKPDQRRIRRGEFSGSPASAHPAHPAAE